MTTLRVPPPVDFYNRLQPAFGDANVAAYVSQQIQLRDPFSRFGPRIFGKFTDFIDDVENTGFTALNDGSSGSNAFVDAAGGVYNIVTAAADNDYHAIATDNEPFLFAANKPLCAECCIKHTQGNTSLDAAFWFGLTNTTTTGGLQANAAGPLASYDGALWWKNEDGDTLNFENSNATTQDTESSIVDWPDATWVRLGLYFDGTPTTSRITPYYNVSGDPWGAWVQGPQTTITLSGLDEMHLVLGVKAGPGGGAETLQADWLGCWQVR